VAVKETSPFTGAGSGPQSIAVEGESADENNSSAAGS